MNYPCLGLTTAITLSASFGAACAGGVERSTQPISILFEEGNYAEIAIGRISPSVSGELTFPLLGAPVGTSSGNMLGDETVGSFSIKTDINDKLVFAFVIDQPVGATINYPTGIGYPYGGSNAKLRSTAATAYLRYKFNDAWSAYGGLRAQQLKGTVGLFTGYTLDTNKDREFGYSLGVAWERKDIAARVSLTYHSEIEHTLDSTEFGGAIAPVSLQSQFSTKIPQSLVLDAKTGIAEDTLLFGSIRWVDWSEFNISPPLYVAGVGEPLVQYNSDTITYTIGLGRRFNENWSGAVTLDHEPQSNDFFGNLGPIDGRTGLGLSAIYSFDRYEISGGVKYSWLGDAKTALPGVRNPATGDKVQLASFTDNKAVSFGLRFGVNF
jgi:long-subunit fatty acid transport protein